MEPRITNKAEFLMKVSEAILACTNIGDMSDCNLMIVNESHLFIRSTKSRWWAELNLRESKDKEGEDGK